MSLNICISKLDVNNVSFLGSVNIGKTIICRNESTSISQPVPTVPPGKQLEEGLAPQPSLQPVQPLPEEFSQALIHHIVPGFVHTEVTPAVLPHVAAPPTTPPIIR